MTDLPNLARELGIEVPGMVIGGRSMGGRVCSMAVARGLEVAGLVLLSYPLHPPGSPDKLRVDHFPDIGVPCLFVSADNDPFGSPSEFADHLGSIPAPVTSVLLEGGRHDPTNRTQVQQILSGVASWLRAL